MFRVASSAVARRTAQRFSSRGYVRNCNKRQEDSPQVFRSGRMTDCHRIRLLPVVIITRMIFNLIICARTSFPSNRSPALASSNNFFHASAKRQDDDSSKQTAAVEEKKGFWEPIYSIPLGIAVAVPAISYEWYVVNEETQLAACFIAFTMIVYKNFGGSIHEFLEQDGKRLLAEHNEKEDEIIDLLKSELNDMKQQDQIVKDAQDIQALREETYEKLNAAGKIKPKHEFKAQMERILSLLAQEEAALVEKAKHSLMKEATETVTSNFLSSKDLQKSSLEVAIGQLEGKKGSKADPVQTAFVNFFKNKAKDAAQIDESVEVAATREVLLTKLNSVAMNEGFYFKLDEATGKPKMVV